MIGDDEVFRIEDALNAVEGAELFALACAAHDDSTFELVEVEDVRGLPDGEGAVVGRVDGVGDGLLFKQAKAFGDDAVEGRFLMLRRTRAVKRPQSSGSSMVTGNAGPGFGLGNLNRWLRRDPYMIAASRAIP